MARPDRAGPALERVPRGGDGARLPSVPRRLPAPLVGAAGRAHPARHAAVPCDVGAVRGRRVSLCLCERQRRPAVRRRAVDAGVEHDPDVCLRHASRVAGGRDTHSARRRRRTARAGRGPAPHAAARRRQPAVCGAGHGARAHVLRARCERPDRDRGAPPRRRAELSLAWQRRVRRLRRVGARHGRLFQPARPSGGVYVCLGPGGAASVHGDESAGRRGACDPGVLRTAGRVAGRAARAGAAARAALRAPRGARVLPGVPRAPRVARAARAGCLCGREAVGRAAGRGAPSGRAHASRAAARVPAAAHAAV